MKIMTIDEATVGIATIHLEKFFKLLKIEHLGLGQAQTKTNQINSAYAYCIITFIQYAVCRVPEVDAISVVVRSSVLTTTTQLPPTQTFIIIIIQAQRDRPSQARPTVTRIGSLYRPEFQPQCIHSNIPPKSS